VSGYFAPRRAPRQVPTTAHEGTRADFIARRDANGEAAARGGAARPKFLASAYDLFADPRTLYAAAERVARDGGPARGADGVGPADLDRHANKTLVAELRTALTTGGYRPGPTRTCQIPKPTGGTRPLTILPVADRVVQRAVVDVLTPFVDPQLAPTTFGGRPGRSVAHAIAALAVHVVKTKNPVLVTADVAKAFDNVPLDRLAAELRQRFEVPRLVNLLETIARGRNTTGVGVAQGGALSPLFLNTLMDTAVDRPWQQLHPDRPLFRWVDDLVTTAADVQEGKQLLAELHDLVGGVGLTLKPAAAKVTDLRSEGVEVLGFHLGLDTDGSLAARIADSSFHQLEDHLEQAHRENNPGARARTTTLAWVQAQGTAYDGEDQDRVLERLRRMLTDCDFPGVVTPEELMETWGKAGARYRAVLEAALGDHDLHHHRDGADESRKTATASPARTKARIVPTDGGFPASSTQSRLGHDEPESSSSEHHAVIPRRATRGRIDTPSALHERRAAGRTGPYAASGTWRQRRGRRAVPARPGLMVWARAAPPPEAWRWESPRRPGKRVLRDTESARPRPPPERERAGLAATALSPADGPNREIVLDEWACPRLLDEVVPGTVACIPPGS